MTKSRHFAVCIDNDGYPASLVERKLYEVLDDNGAATTGRLRIIDESGEDYVYSSTRFRPVETSIAGMAALRDPNLNQLSLFPGPPPVDGVGAMARR